LLQFPVIMGATVPVVNVPGIAAGDLCLDGALLAEIFLGRIGRWNDPEIRRLNPSIRLPAAPIAVARRGDPSGTTYLLSDYLAKSSSPWKGMLDGPGGLPANWKTGHAAIGTTGLEELFLRLPNSIAYFDYAYARRRRLNHVRLRNRAGIAVEPGMRSLQAAALSFRWTGGMGNVTTDAGHPDAWPLASPSYVIVRRSYRTADQAANALQALAFFEWACAHGDQIADDMDFVPMPNAVKDEVLAALATRIGADASVRPEGRGGSSARPRG
jgi:phosphate transport system substrate-binding protein